MVSCYATEGYHLLRVRILTSGSHPSDPSFSQQATTLWYGTVTNSKVGIVLCVLAQKSLLLLGTSLRTPTTPLLPPYHSQQLVSVSAVSQIRRQTSNDKPFAAASAFQFFCASIARRQGTPWRLPRESPTPPLSRVL